MPSPRLLIPLLFAAILVGCGFHLRGAQSAALPYKSLYIALPETAEVRIWLGRYIRAGGGTDLVDDGKTAEATFQQLSDRRDKMVLSVNALGRVLEYRLQLVYRFRIVNAKGQEIIPPNEIEITRDITYDDSSVLAKDAEEALVWRDINNDLVNQILRRLSIVKPRNPDEDEDEDSSCC